MSGPEPRARVTCVHATRCGGCALISLSYGEQKDHKAAQVARAAGRYPDLAALPVAPVRGADPIVEYRTRAKLLVASGGRVGLYARGGAHEVLDVPGCRVLSPTLSAVASELRARVARDEATGGPLAPRRDGAAGGLRGVDLREVLPPDGSAPEVLVTLIVERSPAFRLEGLREAARAIVHDVPPVAGVAANFHDGAHPQALGAETARLAGDAAREDRLGAAEQSATFGAFTQAHRGQAEAIRALVGDALAGRRRLLDVYGGSGAFALGLASRGAEVVLVESFAPAAARAEADAARQGLAVRAMAMDATRALEALVRRREAFDGAVVNPPRRGMAPGVRQALARLAPAVVVYVSCDPETLARDLDHLARLGYRADGLQPFDMIPLTDHVETVAVLRRAPAPAPRVLYEDRDLLAVAKGPHEPTTPQGEHEGSLLARVRALAPEATPVHRLDVGTSGVVLFGRTPARVAAFARALAAGTARKVYLAAVRGVAPDEGVADAPIPDGPRRLAARTGFRRIGSVGAHSLVEVSPEEGRTHQIRIHLAGLGHPVLGDARYGHAATNRHFEEKHGLDRTFLHCGRIEIVHPTTGARLVVEAPLAGDLAAVLGSAGGAITSGAPPPPPPDRRRAPRARPRDTRARRG